MMSVRKAGTALLISVISTLEKFLSIKTPTNTSAGAVAQEGTMLARGERKRQAKKQSEVTRLARPVLAPAATPDALSTKVVQVDVPRTEPETVATESQVIALLMSMGSPFSSSIFASVAGLQRELPLCKLNDELYIAAFVIFGDIELTVASARELVKIAPEHDVIITSESKGIPLAYEMARQMGVNKYVLARKSKKLYMGDVFSVEVNSITTAKTQVLHLDGADAEYLKDKRVLIVDDVISTGESLRAIEALVKKAGGIIVGKMAILAEGDAKDREDIKYLAPLPLFDANGSAIV